MIRLVGFMCMWCAVVGLCVSADEPKKPQWQRLLTGDAARMAMKLQEKADELAAKDDYVGAIKAAEELLALRIKLQGEDHHETVGQQHEVAAMRKVAALSAEKRRGWRTSLARAVEAEKLEDRGRNAEALPERQSHLKWSQEVLGEEHPYTASSYNNVASNLDAQGKYVQAQPLYQKALDIHRKALGEEHPYTATSYNNVAFNLNAQGKYVQAQPLYQKALDIYRKVLGEEHADTASSYSNVASNLDALGKHVQAQPLYQKALDIHRKVLGEEHPLTATSYNNVAFNLHAQGKRFEALPLYQKALDIRRKVLGEEHADTASSYSNVASNLDALGKHVQAQPLYQKALDIHRKVLGEEHPYTAQSYNNLAGNLNAQGKHVQALPLFQKALEIYRKALGEEHPDTANGYSSVASNLDAQGKHIQAQSLYQKALDIRRKSLGEEHPYTATSYNNVAFNLDAQGKHVQALPLFQKALDIRRKVLGEEHPSTATSYNNVAYNLYTQDKYAHAQPLYQKALDVRRKVLGEAHPSTATSYSNVATNLAAQGKYVQAQPLYQKALDVRRKVLGEEHPSTADGYNNSAVNLAAQGKHAEAQAILEHAIYSYESSRLAGATGLDRASFGNFNPRLLLAALQQGRDPNRAWRQVELSLARGLLDQQATRHDPALTSAERAEQVQHRQHLSSIQPQILYLVTKGDRTKSETATLERLLQERREAETKLATVDAAASQRLVSEPEDVRKSLPADTALLFWIDVSDKVDVSNKNSGVQEHWVCTVRSTGDPKWERLPGTGPDNKWTSNDADLPRKFRTALARSVPQPEIEALAKQLHTQRIAPILKHLNGIKTLHVVPVHEMAGVPVELLVPNVSVSYVPSGTFLARARSQAPFSGQRALALGDPIFIRAEDKLTKVKPLPSGGLLITQVLPGSIAAKARPLPLQPGDVILKYADVEAKDLDALTAAIIANEKANSIELTLWREDAEKPVVRDVVPGRLGVVLAKDPAPVAIGNRRKTDALLLAVNRGSEWKDLPGTRVEIDRLRQMLGDQCQILADSEASEQRLDALRRSGELTKFRYLHFATHGAGNSVQAFESALILAQDKIPKKLLSAPNEPFLNGQLSAAEVREFWKLNADLVMLSACETAIGSDGRGDGLLGFAQAFLHAGTRSVCLSLWKVDDTATALLMDRFYQNLLGKRPDPKDSSKTIPPMSKAAALDEAKRWLRNLSSEEALVLTAKMTNGVVRRGERSKGEQLKLTVGSDDPKRPTKGDRPFAHPRYWAAFVLIGDPN